MNGLIISNSKRVFSRHLRRKQIEKQDIFRKTGPSEFRQMAHALNVVVADVVAADAVGCGKRQRERIKIIFTLILVISTMIWHFA